MDAATARSLVEYINGHSTHIFAYTMDFGERTWVILQDANAPRTAPCEQPILEVHEYLDRLKRGASSNNQNRELRSLIEEWLELHPASGGEHSSTIWPATQVMPTVSPLAAAAAS